MKRFFALLLVLVAMLSISACDEAELYPVSWEHVTGLPLDFPQLSEKLTQTSQSFGDDKTEVELVWAELSEAELDEYKAKIELWAAASFEGGAITATVNGVEYTITSEYTTEKSVITLAYTEEE